MHSIDWAEIIFQAPHAAFDRISAEGYRLGYWLFVETPGSLEIRIEAYLREERVAHANLTCQIPERVLISQHVETDGQHQHKGIANAMYVFAEKLAGLPIYPFWEEI